MFCNRYFMVCAVVLLGTCASFSIGYAKDDKAVDMLNLIGSQCDTLVKMQYPILKNVALGESLQKLASQINEASEKPMANLSVELLNEQVPNIFSFPNRIYITTGLLDILASKDELAHLMAKEVAYLTGQRHLSFYNSEKSKKKAIRWVIGTLGALVTVAVPMVSAFSAAGSVGAAAATTSSLSSQIASQVLVQTGSSILFGMIERAATEEKAPKIETVFDNQVAGLKRQALLAKQEGKEEAYQRLNEDVSRLDAQRKKHIQEMRQQNPRYAAVYFPQPVMPAEVPAATGEYLLRYKVTDSSVLIWLVKEAALVHMETVPLKREVLREKVQRYLEPFQGVSSHAQLAKYDAELSGELYDLLFKPVAGKIPEGSHVIIVPDDILEVLPFESLVMEMPAKVEMAQGNYGPFPKGVKYLADRVRLSYYYSATAMQIIRQTHMDAPPALSLFVMADPSSPTEGQELAQDKVQRRLMTMAKEQEWKSLQAQFRPLPHARELADTLKQLFPDGRVLVGVDAKKDNLTDIEKYRYVVFATHGILAKELPYLVEPALLLSPEEGSEGDIRPKGFLTMSEVMKMTLTCDNASLTACSTGLGRRSSGEGVMSMGWAFQYAGAKSVLVSLWNVEEKSTILLTGKYFEHLKSGKNKMTALTDARAELRRMGYEHPFYWAPFILVGEIN